MPGALRALARRWAGSQVAAALCGLAIAHGIWWRNGPGMQSVLDAITRQPLSNAADLAFRFGSEEHARALLFELKRTPGNVELGELDDMIIELRLGVLAAEHASGLDQPTPHLEAAVAACSQARRTGDPDHGTANCDPARLREMMGKLATGRVVP
jgi:hypothetical protein